MTVSGVSEKTANHRVSAALAFRWGLCGVRGRERLPVRSSAFGWYSPNTLQKTWSQILFCIVVAGGVSGCSDAQEADSGLPSDPVAHELMQRKAEEASRAFVSAAEVSAADPKRAVAVASLLSEGVLPGDGAAGLPDSFRLLARNAADVSARAAHAAADAVGVPDVPQSRLQPKPAEQVADNEVAVDAELPVIAPHQLTDGKAAGESQASGAESAVGKKPAVKEPADVTKTEQADDAAVQPVDSSVTPVAAGSASEAGSVATSQAASTARSGD